MRKGWAALGKKCNAYFGKSVAFLLFIAAILAGAAPAAAQSTCTVTSADLPSLEVAAGSSNNVIISSLGFNTPARNAILTKCGFTTSGGLRYRNVDANSNVSTGNTTFNLVTGSTLVHGVGLSFTYTPAAGLTGTENVSPTVATGSFAGQTIRLEAAADIALATPITVVTLQVTITGGTPAPTVTAVSPNAGSTAGGTVVTLTGTDFTGVTGVSFGASPAASFTFNNATSITATTPPGAAGTVNARVTTPGGTSATAAANQFTYVGAPTTPTITSSPPVTSGATSATFTFTLGSGQTAECQLNGSAFSACTSPRTYTGLSEGSQTFSVRGVNTLGQTSTPASYSWTIDTTAPAAPVVTAPANGSFVANARPTVTGTAEPLSTVTVRVDASPVGTTTANASGNFSFTLGTSLSVGSHTVNATASDAVGNTSPTSNTNSFTVAGTLTTTLAVPSATATVGTAITPFTPVSASGGGGVLTYAVSAGLPGGITFNTANGQVSGTPTAASSATNYTVTVSDQSGQSSQQVFSLTVNRASQTISFNTAAPSGALVGGSYTPSATATSGLTVSFSIDGASAGICTISGGVVNFNNVGTCRVNADQTGDADYSPAPQVQQSFAIAAPAPTVTAVSPNSGSTAGGTVVTITGANFSGASAVTFGATPAVGFTVFSATSISATAPSGSPGTVNVRVTTAGGTSATAAANQFTYFTPTLTLAPTSLPNPGYGNAYSQTITASGGTGNVSYAITGGALPAGLTLSNAGVLSGTPTAVGSFTFTVTATDSAPTPVTGDRQYTVNIAAPTITLSPAALGSAAVGTGFTDTLSASGGIGPYSFAVTGGSLPPGLSLQASGPLSGTPTAGGTFTFTVTATDANNFTGSRAYSLTIGGPTIAVTGPASTSGTVGIAYSSTLDASGGTAPYSFLVTGGALPPGVSLGGNGGLSGTPTAAGTYAATITATDSSTGTGPFTGTLDLQLTIAEAPPVAGAVSATVAYNAAATPITLALSGGPATDVTVASPAANGTTSAVGTSISYTPNRDYVGPDSFTYTATGPGGTSAPATVTITVAPPPAPSATNRSGVTVGYNSGGTAIDLSGNVSGVVSSIELASNPAHGTAQVSGTTVTYTPVTDYFGSDSFTFVAVGPGGRSSPATVSLTVETPPAPTAAAVSATTPYETAAQIDLAPSVSGVATSVAIVTGPANGTASLSGQVITYTPNAGYFGSDEITYTATGPGGTSDPATISITVGLPPAPTAAGTTVSTPFETAATIDTAPLVTGVSRSIAIASAPTHGTASVSGSVITYTPSTDYDGPDSFTYTATGPGGTSAPATVNVTVEPLPPPEPAARQLSTDSTTPVSVDVTTGLRGAPFTVAIATPPPSGQASVQGGVITFTPASDSPANVRFTFTVTSRFGTSQPTEINVAVRLIPVPVRQRNLQALAGTTVSQSLTEGATGGPFTAATIVTTVDPSAGTATIVRNGGTFTLNFAAASTFAGTVRIGYTLSNAVATSEVAFVDVTVTARPDPTDDPTVRGIIDAQVQATQRFATGQIRNIGSRLEQLHDGGGSGFNSRLGVGGNLFTHYALNDPALLDPFTSFNPGAQLAYQNASVISDRPAGVLGGAFGGALTANGQGGGRSAGGIGGTGAAAAADAEGAPSGGSDEVNPFGLWIGGTIEFGNREREDGRRDFTFTTGGITAGLDYRFSDTFILGASVGYGRDQSDVGRDLGDVTSDSWSGAVYASAQPAPNLFIDGLVGYGWMTFDTRRVVTETGNEVRGERDGEQVFTSVNVTYEYRGKRWWIAPYGRLDYVGSTLFEYAETGDPVYALRTLNQSSDLVTGATGVRVRYRVPLGRGFLTPTGRAEFQYDLTESGIARLRYADLADGLVYSFSPQRYDRARALLGAGLSYSGPGGAQLKLDYEGTLLDNGSNHLIRVTAGIRF